MNVKVGNNHISQSQNNTKIMSSCLSSLTRWILCSIEALDNRRLSGYSIANFYSLFKSMNQNPGHQSLGRARALVHFRGWIINQFNASFLLLLLLRRWHSWKWVPLLAFFLMQIEQCHHCHHHWPFFFVITEKSMRSLNSMHTKQ